jgi:hypothetical protein
VPNEAGVVDTMSTGSTQSAQSPTRNYNGRLILDWPHILMSSPSPQPRLAQDNSNQFLLLKHAYCCRNTETRIRDASAGSLLYLPTFFG